MRYVYSILRFVPDPARGEFVNIGAIVGSDECSEWALQLVSNQSRAKRLDEHGVLPKVWSHIGDLDTDIEAYQDALEEGTEPPVEISEGWLAQLQQDFRNVVQLSQPAPIVSDTLEDALGFVFDKFIVDPVTRRFEFQKKNVATAAVRRAFRDFGLQKGGQYFETLTVRGSHHKERFDFAVANGRALQLTHTFSFQVPDKEGLFENIKAWAFTVEDVRQNGGSAIKDAKHLIVPRDVPVAVVYVPPKEGDDGDVLEEAHYAFDKIDAQHYPLEQANSVGRLASDLLTKYRA